MGIEGAMFQMISHGIISGALFLCVGVLYDRMHSRLIVDYGGVANTMPVFAAFFMLFALANVGLPGTSGFVGEFLVILSAFKASFWIALGAATILILGASYTLWMFKRVVFGAIRNEAVAGLLDIHFSEKMIFIILSLAVVGLGLYPKPLLSMFRAPSQHLVEQILQSKR
jgi:NADH-quinone oxidoreductase subunit M